MKFQVNLRAYWFNMIKGVYIFYEVIIKSQILSSKFILKKSEKFCHIVYPQPKPTYMALNVKETIIYFFHCIFSLWPDSSEMLKV